jgi:hypothetical protein
MEMDKVIQAFAVQVFTAAMDMAQQVDPLEAGQVAEQQARAEKLAEDVGTWLAGLSQDDIDAAHHFGPDDGLPFDRWMPLSDAYDATAVCAMVQAVIRSLPANLPQVEIVRGAGKYLLDMSDHKLGWLIERAANLLTINMGEE